MQLLSGLFEVYSDVQAVRGGLIQDAVCRLGKLGVSCRVSNNISQNAAVLKTIHDLQRMHVLYHRMSYDKQEWDGSCGEVLNLYIYEYICLNICRCSNLVEWLAFGCGLRSRKV